MEGFVLNGQLGNLVFWGCQKCIQALKGRIFTDPKTSAVGIHANNDSMIEQFPTPR